MARFVTGLVAGMVIATVAGAAAGLHAQVSTDDIANAAHEAGVSEMDLRGALNSQAMHGLTADPWTYLRSNRELPSEKTLPPPAAASPSASASGVWARLAQCESSGVWNRNSGNGYFGGIQFDRQTWLAYGGGAFAARADLAAPAQQIAVAERLRAARGFQPWPACSRALGLR
jgi:resuscitation-promoting factor RpfB